jgi:hypothetical protein
MLGWPVAIGQPSTIFRRTCPAKGDLTMSLVRVHNFSVSLDGRDPTGRRESAGAGVRVLAVRSDGGVLVSGGSEFPVVVALAFAAYGS